MMIIDFFLFLFSPEDSSDNLTYVRKSEKLARFDNRFYGGLKIFFWIGVTVAFWIGLLLFLQKIATICS